MATIIFPEWTPAALAECIYYIPESLEDKLWELEGREDWRNELTESDIAALNHGMEKTYVHAFDY